MKKEDLEKRNCFGTKEYSPTHQICRTCMWFEECGEVISRTPKPRHTRQFKEHRLYSRIR